MKPPIPLALKVALMLLLNLAVLVIAGAVFIGITYGVSWSSLLSGGAGERVRQLGAHVVRELREPGDASVDEILERTPRDAGTDVYLFTNDNARQIGGPAIVLPAPVHAALVQSGEPPGNRPAPPAGSQPRRDFDRPAGAPRPGFGSGRPPPPGGPGPNGAFGFIHHVGTPAAYWVGLRIPVNRPQWGEPERGTLILRIPSTLALLRWLNFGPWLAAVVIAFLLSVVCWAPFVFSVRRALRRITEATYAIAEGKLDTRVMAHRRDELGALGHSVNQMTERLEVLVHGQKRFLGDVAHELGSPLGRLQVGLELLERDAPSQLKSSVADVREEVEEMSALVNELLAFTRADLGAKAVTLRAVPLLPLLKELCERLDSDRVHLAVDPALSVSADERLLQRAVSNLLRNALRYAPRGRISIVAQRQQREVILAIADEGPGVPAETLARLGEPFFRPDVARSRDTGGNGLGLAIVKASIAACGGSVRFANRAPSGFLAEIVLGAAA
jgi:two-component system, OmpR family, sensor histidine kinase CpxA